MEDHFLFRFLQSPLSIYLDILEVYCKLMNSGCL